MDERALVQRREVLAAAGEALRRCRADGADLEGTAAAVTSAVLEAVEQHIVLTLAQIEALALIAHGDGADELEIGPHADAGVFVMPCPRGRFCGRPRRGRA